MGENYGSPWALLFKEDYEEHKTAHKGTEDLTARQGSAIHKAQKHKSTEYSFTNNSGNMTIFMSVGYCGLTERSPQCQSEVI